MHSSKPVLPLTAMAFVLFWIAYPAQAQQKQQVVEVDQAVVTLLEQVLVPIEEAGVVREIGFKEGDMVRKGQVLAELDNETFRLNVAIAESELNSSRITAASSIDIEYAIKSMEVARKTLERSMQANERAEKAVSQTEIERLDLEYKRAQLTRQRAEMEKEIAAQDAQIKSRQLDLAKLRLQQRTIISPIDGRVLDKSLSPGEWASSGQTLVRVVRLDRLKVQFFLAAKQFDAKLLGSPVELTVPMPPEGKEATFAGVIRFVSPEIIPNREQFSVWAEIENPELKLRPGVSGKLKVLPR